MSAVLLVRDRRVLMVRARARDVLYLPGGKAEPHESDVQAALREAHEETGLRLEPSDVEPFGTVTEPAHGQAPGTMVAMALFLVRPGGATDSASPVASAEVDEVEWVTSADADRCPPAGVETLRRLVAAGLVD
ncbi:MULTISPECIES: NUDIX domain-containing protein [unclassified Curtobacterium]|uniref:NUDIX hydrolase n=1 Tax=unclassified Curtobacterium TaxID=257496 RepID=UPI000A8A0464|nr:MULTISPECIES: NUDIX domain-containing protein [unclassified Curtobacterium]WIA96882.1 NUDIX domain-containing protein [Curtobacterium sp. MCBA15_004]